MKLGVTSVILSIALAVSAATNCSCPCARPDRNVAQKQIISLGAEAGEVVGAAYFATNSPSGNYLVASDIGSDGKVSMRTAYNTGGVGVHGVQHPEQVADSMFSQGSVKVSPTGNMVAVVNSGSNTISLFSIDPTNPSNLTMIGTPVPSGGQFPVSVVFNQASDTLCAANGGAIDGVSCFRVDPMLGLQLKDDVLRPIGLNQTTPATGPFHTAGMITFTEDESQLVVAVKGAPPNDPGYLAFWDMASGCPSKEFKKLSPAKGGIAPFSASIIPGKNALISADPGIGFVIWDLNDVDNGKPGNNSRASANSIPEEIETCWSNLSPSTGNFIFVDANMSFITEVSLDEDLKPTILTHVQDPGFPRIIDFAIGTIDNHDYAYILGPNATVFDVMSLDGPGITPHQRMQLSETAQENGLEIDNIHMQGMGLWFKN